MFGDVAYQLKSKQYYSSDDYIVLELEDLKINYGLSNEVTKEECEEAINRYMESLKDNPIAQSIVKSRKAKITQDLFDYIHRRWRC